MTSSTPTDPRDESPILLTKDQAAALIGISTSYVKVLMARGELPYRKIATRCVRLHRDDVVAFANRAGERMAQ